MLLVGLPVASLLVRLALQTALLARLKAVLVSLKLVSPSPSAEVVAQCSQSALSRAHSRRAQVGDANGELKRCRQGAQSNPPHSVRGLLAAASYRASRVC